jgi:hypothetical protein
LILREAVTDWAIESPQDKVNVSGAAPTHFTRDMPDGPVYTVSGAECVAAPKPLYSPEPEFSEKPGAPPNKEP